MDSEESSIQSLPKATVRLIGSAQVITSVVSVVKELVENSLDAGATTIDIKLENYGFDKTEIRDNGSGIKESDRPSMGLPHHTSKITHTDDLSRLVTYGFRGEALASLCATSRVSVTTKTSEDDVGMTYELGPDGMIADKKPSHLGQGTTVTATHLFHNVPVRRQYYNTVKRRKEELKKVEDLIIAYSVIKYDVRFTLRHNRDVVWQKTSMTSLRQSLFKVVGSSAFSLMVHKQVKHDNPQCELELYVSRPDADCHVMSRTCADRCFVFINHRPVTHKEITKMLKQAYSAACGCEGSRWPLACLSVIVPPGALDVNLEPNKTRVLLQENTDVLAVLGQMFEEIYGQTEDPAEKAAAKGAPPNDVQEHEKGLHGDANHQHSVQQSSEQGAATSLGRPRSDGVDSDSETTPQEKGDKQQEDQTVPVESRHFQQAEDHQQQDSTLGQKLHQGDGATSAESSTATLSDVTLSLSRPLHNSTRCDVTVNSQSVTFDLLQAFDDTDDDIFDMVQDVTTPGRSTDGHQGADDRKQTTLNSPSSDVTSEAINNKQTTFDSLGSDVTSAENNPKQTTGGALSCDVTMPTLPSLDVDMLGPVDISKVASMVARSTSIETVTDNNQQTTNPADRPGAWSRGQTVTDNTGRRIEPVQLLQPGAAGTSRDSELSMRRPSEFATPASKMKQAANSPGQMTLMDVTNHSNIKKPTTAFIFFSKETRPSVVAENPGADFQTVAKLIGEKWKALMTDQREKYEKMMTKDVQRYREQVSLRKETEPHTAVSHGNKRRKQDEHNHSIREMLRSPAASRTPQKKQKVAPRLTTTVEFSLTQLKERFIAGPTTRTMEGDLPILVGEVKPDGWWVGMDRDQVVGIAPWRLQETLIYNQLMENHSLPTEKLDEPLKVSPSVLGSDDLWTTLLSLSHTTSHQTDSTYLYLTDPRLSRSGFSIRRTQEEAPRVEVISMARSINLFGVRDLCEVLDHVRRDVGVSVTDSRPAKVKHFLQGEAARMSRQMPHRVTAEEVRHLLQRMRKRMGGKSSHCFHHRPFMHTLYDLTDLPLSQVASQPVADR